MSCRSRFCPARQMLRGAEVSVGDDLVVPQTPAPHPSVRMADPQKRGAPAEGAAGTPFTSRGEASLSQCAATVREGVPCPPNSRRGLEGLPPRVLVPRLLEGTQKQAGSMLRPFPRLSQKCRRKPHRPSCSCPPRACPGQTCALVVPPAVRVLCRQVWPSQLPLAHRNTHGATSEASTLR